MDSNSFNRMIHLRRDIAVSPLLVSKATWQFPLLLTHYYISEFTLIIGSLSHILSVPSMYVQSRGKVHVWFSQGYSLVFSGLGWEYSLTFTGHKYTDLTPKFSCVFFNVKCGVLNSKTVRWVCKMKMVKSGNSYRYVLFDIQPMYTSFWMICIHPFTG